MEKMALLRSAAHCEGTGMTSLVDGVHQTGEVWYHLASVVMTAG